MLQISWGLLALTILNSCSIYESDARKFLRERGFELTNSAKSNQQLSQKHCFQTSSTNILPEWENVENSEKYIIRYYDTSFSCTFEKTKPLHWSEEELNLIEEIVAYYKENN